MAFLGPNNALAWAHFRLRGGWQRSLTFTAAATIILIMLIVGSVYADPLSRTRALFGWTTGLLAFQAAVLVFYVVSRISQSLRTDLQGKIIESHRLMPTPATDAVAGYISGAALGPLVLSGAIFLVGMFTAGAAGVEVKRWLFAHFILLAFAMFAWTVAAFACFDMKLGPALIFIPLFILPSIIQTGGLSAVPGLIVVVTPIAGDSIFDMRNAGFDLPATYAMALAAQAYFGAIFFIAAARRYRSAAAVGIDTHLGLLLVAGWAAVSCLGINQWDLYRPRGWNWRELTAEVKTIASLVSAMLIALSPVAASAWAQAQWRRHQVLHDPAPMRRPMASVLVIVIATALIMLIPFAKPWAAPPDWRDVALTTLIVAIALASMYFLCAWVYYGYSKAAVAGFIWIFLMWAMPIMVDLVRYGLADMGETQPIAGVATASPVGALIAIWTHLQGVDVRPGIVLQLLLMGIPLTLRLMQVMSLRRARHGL